MQLSVSPCSSIPSKARVNKYTMAITVQGEADFTKSCPSFKTTAQEQQFQQEKQLKTLRQPHAHSHQHGPEHLLRHTRSCMHWSLRLHRMCLQRCPRFCISIKFPGNAKADATLRGAELPKSGYQGFPSAITSSQRFQTAP